MPEISRFYGIIIYMQYMDHNPPHFHAVNGEFELLVEIESEVVLGTMPGKSVKLILDWLNSHREELLENWNLAQERKPLCKIEPLK